MSTRILGPDGVQVETDRTQLGMASDFHTATDFNLQTGRGSVKLRLPDADAALVPLLEKMRDFITQTEARNATEFGQRLMNDIGAVILLLSRPRAFALHPAEARILGMRLIVQGEQAVSQAVFLRAMLESIQMPPAEAVHFFRNLDAGTRADHAMAYEQALKAVEQQDAMSKPTEGVQ